MMAFLGWEGRTEQFLRRENKLAQTHLLALATVTPPGGQITKPCVGWAAGEGASRRHGARSPAGSWGGLHRLVLGRQTLTSLVYSQSKKETAFSLLISTARGRKVRP